MLITCNKGYDTNFLGNFPVNVFECNNEEKIEVQNTVDRPINIANSTQTWKPFLVRGTL